MCVLNRSTIRHSVIIRSLLLLLCRLCLSFKKEPSELIPAGFWNDLKVLIWRCSNVWEYNSHMQCWDYDVDISIRVTLSSHAWSLSIYAECCHNECALVLAFRVYIYSSQWRLINANFLLIKNTKTIHESLCVCLLKRNTEYITYQAYCELKNVTVECHSPHFTNQTCENSRSAFDSHSSALSCCFYQYYPSIGVNKCPLALL